MSDSYGLAMRAWQMRAARSVRQWVVPSQYLGELLQADGVAASRITVIPHFFHHSCYLVADVDRMPRAGLGGYDPNISGNSALFQALPEVFQRLGGGSPSMSQHGAPPRILNCIPEPVEGAWMIDSVAAVPEFRRQGIVSKLLETVIKQGREKGFRHAQVNIYIGNTSAQRLYEKHGFAILDEMRDSYFEAEIGSPGMARMLRDL